MSCLLPSFKWNYLYNRISWKLAIDLVETLFNLPDSPRLFCLLTPLQGLVGGYSYGREIINDPTKHYSVLSLRFSDWFL